MKHSTFNNIAVSKIKLISNNLLRSECISMDYDSCCQYNSIQANDATSLTNLWGLWGNYFIMEAPKLEYFIIVYDI